MQVATWYIMGFYWDVGNSIAFQRPTNPEKLQQLFSTKRKLLQIWHVGKVWASQQAGEKESSWTAGFLATVWLTKGNWPN